MEVRISQHLGGSVFIGHGALPIGERQVPVELLVKHNEGDHVAELHLDDQRPTLIEGKKVLKYTNAKISQVPSLEVGTVLNFQKFFINTKK